MADTPTPPLLEPGFLARLEQLELVTRKIFSGKMKGERRSKRKGQSIEFADYRNYVIGDDLRFLDWNLFARLDRLFLRLFMEEEDLHVYLLIDNSLSMAFPETKVSAGPPSKLRYATQVAAALGYVGLFNMDRVKVDCFSDNLGPGLPAIRGRKSLWRLLDFLSQVEAAERGNLSQSLKTFSLQASGKGVVVILSDFMDKSGYEEALRYLVARQYDIYAIQILSQEEIEPELLGDLKLTDVEDGDVAEITVNGPLLKRYKRNLKAYQAALHEFCTRRGVRYVFTSNRLPFEKLVLNYLRQRGLVR